MVERYNKNANPLKIEVVLLYVIFSWCRTIEKDIEMNRQLNIQCPIHKYMTATFSGLVQRLH